jgi:hypothetical protein
MAAIAVLAAQTSLHAHSGPPFPIVTDAVHGPYTVSIWTDPDATDDGSAGGQFWVVIAPSTKGGPLPADTRATVTVQSSSTRPVQTDRPYPFSQSTRTEPVRGDISNQFGAVVMDHEGPYSVHVEVTGPLGQTAVDAMVDATYDLRPPPYMLVWYLVPFLLVGFLWTRLLLRRRSALPRRSSAKAGGRGPSDRVQVP